MKYIFKSTLKKRQSTIKSDVNRVSKLQFFYKESVVKKNYLMSPHFMFQLNEQEVEIMVSQNAIPSKQHLGGDFPYVFTEHGVLMLANVLRNDQAIHLVFE